MNKIFKTPPLIARMLPNYEWRLPTSKKEVFLTFDDGPSPHVTEWVLRRLDDYNAKATFFMVGKNVLSYPDLAREVVRNGHAIGNHTFTHLSGWTNFHRDYISEIELADAVIESVIGFKPPYFRPPYGRINFIATSDILKTHKIIMWDILGRDFDGELTARACIDNIIRHIKPGSTIVLHDSPKCALKLKVILPELLDFLAAEEYALAPICC